MTAIAISECECVNLSDLISKYQQVTKQQNKQIKNN